MLNKLDAFVAFKENKEKFNNYKIFLNNFDESLFSETDSVNFMRLFFRCSCETDKALKRFKPDKNKDAFLNILAKYNNYFFNLVDFRKPFLNKHLKNIFVELSFESKLFLNKSLGELEVSAVEFLKNCFKTVTIYYIENNFSEEDSIDLFKFLISYEFVSRQITGSRLAILHKAENAGIENPNFSSDELYEELIKKEVFFKNFKA